MPGWYSGTATGLGSWKLPEEMGGIRSQSTFNSVPGSLNLMLRLRAPTGLGAGVEVGGYVLRTFQKDRVKAGGGDPRDREGQLGGVSENSEAKGRQGG